MASPWVTQTPAHRPIAERPWTGMALLVAVPLLSLVLIRMLWSGSSLWFLTVGIILLGAAAVVFLARRPDGLEYDRGTLDPGANRVPLILAGLGVLFLAMLLLPNFAGGSSDSQPVAQQDAPDGIVAWDAAPQVQPPVVQEPAGDVVEPAVQEPVATGQQIHVIASGDTLWDIALEYGTTVDAIAEANGLANAAELVVGQELVIPAGEVTTP